MSQTADSVAVARKVSIGLLTGVVLCLLLALLLFFMTGGQTMRVPWLNVQVLPEEPGFQQLVDDEVLERPLFWESRRPLKVQEDAPQEQAARPIEPLTGVKVLGIITQGETQMALLEIDGKPGRYKPGDAVKQWQVADVTGNQVHFASADGENVLTLEREVHKGIRLGP